jgi:hypothetical protein
MRDVDDSLGNVQEMPAISSDRARMTRRKEKPLIAIQPGIRVVYLKSTHDSESYKRALALGAAAFFKKPVHGDLDEFVHTLCAIVGIDGPERS